MQGSIVGAQHKVGHRLRDLKHDTPQGKRKKVDVLIAGGGIAALTAAWRLRSGGVEDYLMLELESIWAGLGWGGQLPSLPGSLGGSFPAVPTLESTVVRRI